MKENRGLTLVELLVTIAILSVVLLVATSFMTTGSRSFARGSADTQVQKEAELAVNQMEDMIIDVNGGVDLKKDDATGDRELILYNAGGESGTVDYTKESIIYKAADQKILCSKWKVRYDVASASYVVDSAEYTNQLLAENVTGFEADLSDVYEDTASDGSTIEIVKSVQFKVGYEDGTGKANYATSPIITLRNRMMKSDNPTAIFDDTPVETDTLSLYISDTDMAAAVKIQDGVTEVTRNNLYNIYAMINRGDNVNSLVDWEIEEGNTLSVIDSEGKLSVSQYEPCAYLTITAKYKSNPNKKATGVVKVVGGSIKSLDAVSITTESLLPFNPVYGSIVSTTGFTELEIGALSYTWTVSAPDGVTYEIKDNNSSSEGFELTIPKESQNYGKWLTITLKVHSDVTNRTVSDSITYRIDSEGTTGGDSNMERGKASTDVGAHGDVWYSFDTPFYPTDITYEYYFCDQYGNYISALDFLKSKVVITVGHGSYNLTFTEELPPDHEYYLKVIIKYELNNGTQYENWSYERIHYIPAVSLYGVTSSSTATLSVRSCEFWYKLEGYYELAWNSSVCEYSIEDLVYEVADGADVTVTADVVQTETRGTSLIWGRCQFSCSDWMQANKVTLKSMTIKVSLKGYPDICAYSTVIFN